MPPKKTRKPTKKITEIDNKISDEGVTLPIRWNVPKDIPTLHATNLLVQHSADEFVVMFFEVRPPILLDPVEAQKYLENSGELEAECLARIVITPERMVDFIEAMQTNYDRYMAKKDNTREGIE